jgi:hypothetical protein
MMACLVGFEEQQQIDNPTRPFGTPEVTRCLNHNAQGVKPHLMLDCLSFPISNICCEAS